jgi:hypothetical protein
VKFLRGKAFLLSGVSFVLFICCMHVILSHPPLRTQAIIINDRIMYLIKYNYSRRCYQRDHASAKQSEVKDAV